MASCLFLLTSQPFVFRTPLQTQNITISIEIPTMTILSIMVVTFIMQPSTTLVIKELFDNWLVIEIAYFSIKWILSILVIIHTFSGFPFVGFVPYLRGAPYHYCPSKNMDPCDKYRIYFQWCLNWKVRMAFHGEKVGLMMAKEVALQEAMVIL